jgi:enoyl-CoA hydratase/carnithine racemase
MSFYTCFGLNGTLKDSYEYIQSQVKGVVSDSIHLHRPKAVNALSDALFQDLIHTLPKPWIRTIQ